jgi:glycosyltransferase involved in cell wall biosynthesis
LGVLTTAFFVLFVVAVAVQCGYACYFFSRVVFGPSGGRVGALSVSKEHDETSLSYRRQPVSIIICAKNEALNLQQNLPAILAQRYANDAGKPFFEVIVVNDASTDDTAHILQTLEQQYDNLWDVTIPLDAVRTLQGKKFALSKGLALATHPWLLLTDADCRPASNDWLQHMIAPLANSKEIVAGYGGYYSKYGLLNAFIRWETVHTFLQYGAYVLAGKPYMAVGRNLACTKEILLKAQQAEVWNKLPSGDDDLLVNIAATADNMDVVYTRESFTHSAAKQTWGEWVRQKQRHLSTGKFYKKGVKRLLGVYGLSHAVMWLLFFILLFSGMWQVVLWMMLGRVCVYWLLFAVLAMRLKERTPALLYPVFDFGWMIYNFAFAPYIIWKTKKQWT